jgi:hypothetical protein
MTTAPTELEGLFCDVCGRDANDIADEDFFVPRESAGTQGYLSGRCQRHPPEDASLFRVVHVGGGEPDEASLLP